MISPEETVTGELVPAGVDPHPGRVAALAEAFIATRRANATRRGYRHDLTAWLDYCARHRIDPLDAWPAHVSAWLVELERAGYSGATRARRLGAVSSWYRWLIRHEQATRNPALLDAGERPNRTPVRATPALTGEQVKAFLAAADADTPRAAAMVWVMVFTGLRVGAVLSATVGDIRMDAGHFVLRVAEKGGKTLARPLPGPVYMRVQAYLASREDLTAVPALIGQVGGDRPLFATRAGKRMHPNQVRELVRRLARAAGLPRELADDMSPHVTRATFATAAFGAGIPVRDIQYAMGHASPVTTERYDRSSLSPERDPGYRLMGLLGG